MSGCPTAVKENGDCPGSCADLWGNPKFGHYNGILDDDVYRLALADVEYSGSKHLLLVTVQAKDSVTSSAPYQPSTGLLP